MQPEIAPSARLGETPQEQISRHIKTELNKLEDRMEVHPVQFRAIVLEWLGHKCEAQRNLPLDLLSAINDDYKPED
jgi:hypothetical protein